MAIEIILKTLREKNGLSMAKAASALEIPKGTYASYEYGQREPNIEMINKIATFYGVTTDYLLGRPEAKPPPDPVDVLAEAKGASEIEKVLLNMYFKLDAKKRAAFLQSIVDTVQKNQPEVKRKDIKFVQRASHRNPNHNAPVVEMVETTDEEEKMIDSLPNIDSNHFNSP